ncbi:hypothetical protein PTKIN_Ptkin03bG0253200 [Pterospermum kingtungense]
MLLVKMSPSNLEGRRSKGQKHRGKGKQEETSVFVLKELEKEESWSKTWIRNELPETSCDEDRARHKECMTRAENI